MSTPTPPASRTPGRADAGPQPLDGSDGAPAGRRVAIARRRSTWIGLLILVLVAAAAFWLVRREQTEKKPKAGPPPAIVATTAKVVQRDMPIYRAGIGTVTAALSVTVKPRVDGQLERVGFTEGQDVKAGQLLASIDPRTLQATLAQAQATRAKDAAQLANARVDLQRYTTLIAEDAATQQQLATQKALVAQLEAAVQTDDAAIRYAQVQLGFTSIVAPISGRVGARLVDPGNIVHASDATGLVVINQIDPITVLFTLPEADFQDVNRAINANKGKTDGLVVEAYPRVGTELLGTGRLVLLNNQIDPTTGTVQLKGLFPNAAHTLWPGQFVNTRLVLGSRPKALVLPAAAVQRSQDATFVYVVDDADTVQQAPIHVIQNQDGLAVYDRGPAAGQRVVVDGQYKLRPGLKIVEASKAGARGASGVASGGAGGGAPGGAAGGTSAGPGSTASRQP